MSGVIPKFADDTKISRLIRSDSDKMSEWSNRWQMQFHVNKCKVLIVSRGSPHNKYSLIVSNDEAQWLTSSILTSH